MKNNYFPLLILVLLICNLGISQNDKINILENDLVMNQLKETQNKYLVYIEGPDGSIMDMAVWERNVSFGYFNNEEVINIEQKWKNQDKAKTRSIFSISKRKNFQPLYHYAASGKGAVEAYDFKETKIIGSDSIATNTKKDFILDLTEPTLNWELDMEIFQTLPFALHKAFDINFYHPGSKTPPSIYTYTVVDEKETTLANGMTTDCWLLKIDYDEKNNAVFWIDKNTKEVIKMKEVFGQITRYKVKFITP